MARRAGSDAGAKEGRSPALPPGPGHCRSRARRGRSEDCRLHFGRLHALSSAGRRGGQHTLVAHLLRLLRSKSGRASRSAHRARSDCFPAGVARHRRSGTEGEAAPRRLTLAVQSPEACLVVVRVAGLGHVRRPRRSSVRMQSTGACGRGTARSPAPRGNERPAPSPSGAPAYGGAASSAAPPSQPSQAA